MQLRNTLAIPVFGVAAWSGTGKTTLLKSLLPALRERGLRVGIIKHAHHDFEIDYPGKDSFELRKAGARQVVIASNNREALVRDYPSAREPDLSVLIARFDPTEFDLVLVEGFKDESIPKIELFRPSLGKPPCYVQDDAIIALATDEPITTARALPLLNLNDVEAIAAFIARRIQTPSISPNASA
ncbi:MAG: molybdopterin-guanine dinucleotide biosynthesis protein MobB [Thiotrichales bacterium]